MRSLSNLQKLGLGAGQHTTYGNREPFGLFPPVRPVFQNGTSFFFVEDIFIYP